MMPPAERLLFCATASRPRPAERGRAEPYAQPARWGTLTKLYEYIKSTYITHSSDHSPKARLSLLRKLELRMPNAMLPVRLYECRGFRRVADVHPQMVLTGIMGRLHNLRNPSETLEWDGIPKSFEFRVDRQLIKVAVWAFKKPAQSWRGSHGVLFTLNGQTHATLPDSFFDRNDVGMNPLRKSLLVIVDCSDISSTHESALMMTSRDRLADSLFAKQIKDRMETGGGSWENADHLVDGWHLSEGVAEMRLRLPDTATAGDVLHLKFTVVNDNHETPEFVSTIELVVQPPKESSVPPGTPPQPRLPKGDAPQIREVREEDWDQQVPEPFDGNTALRRIDGGNGTYELRYNADNKWLRKKISRSKSEDQAADLRHQFGVVMAALGLAVMGAHQRASNDKSDHSDHAENGKPDMSVNELIEWCTSAAAPVVASIHSLTTASLGTDDNE
ncbi:hypothetical protein [Candidatus Poriferisodalis sp.]|uniref:hypothetical protein n=1 Tax=Candidatus Poriferisodalis sp. TaxID=3101277 RepID=UPI003B025A48